MVESVIPIKSGITINVDASVKIQKHSLCKKYYIWNLAICSFKNGKYLASFIDDSVITCDEIIEETKTISTNFNKKNIIYETKNFYILLKHSIIDSC